MPIQKFTDEVKHMLHDAVVVALGGKGYPTSSITKKKGLDSRGDIGRFLLLVLFLMLT